MCGLFKQPCLESLRAPAGCARRVHRSEIREQAVAWLLLELLALLASACCIYLLFVGCADGVLSLTSLRVQPFIRCRFLPIFISERAYFLNAEWLPTGWSIWTSAKIWFARDYFLPLPNADASAAIHRVSDYAWEMSFSKRLLKHLQQPVWDGVCWRHSDKSLFMEVGTLAFWT